MIAEGNAQGNSHGEQQEKQLNRGEKSRLVVFPTRDRHPHLFCTGIALAERSPGVVFVIHRALGNWTMVMCVVISLQPGQQQGIKLSNVYNFSSFCFLFNVLCVM